MVIEKQPSTKKKTLVNTNFAIILLYNIERYLDGSENQERGNLRFIKLAYVLFNKITPYTGCTGNFYRKKTTYADKKAKQNKS